MAFVRFPLLVTAPPGGPASGKVEGESLSATGWTVRNDPALSGGRGITCDDAASGVLTLAFSTTAVGDISLVGYANTTPDGTVRARLDGGAWQNLSTFGSTNPARIQTTWVAVAVGAHTVEVDRFAAPDGHRYWLDYLLHY